MTPSRRPRAVLIAGPAADWRQVLASVDVRSLLLPGLAVLVGLAVRVAPLAWSNGFPLNDGGMFYVMVEDIKHAGYRLPVYTSYNGGDIPFAYPSLPFYLAASISDFIGWNTLNLLRFLPLLFSLMTIPAFYLLARAILPTKAMAGLAVLVFATIPRTFNWEIVGGGLTRSPGFFFAVLALWQGYLLFRSGERKHLLPASALSALTILCHMEMGWFLAISLAFFALLAGRDRKNIVNAGALAAGVLVLSAPWWLETLLRLGPDPVVAGFRSGAHSFLAPLRFFTLRSTEEPLFPVALALGLLGLLACLHDRRYLLPVWLALLFVLDPRKAATTSTVPIALLAAYGFSDVVWPLIRPGPWRRLLPVAPWSYVGAALIFVIYAPFSAIASSSQEESPLYALSGGDREAMDWVRVNTPPGATFVVVPSVQQWAVDAPAEWFPALTGRVSLNTVQGSEWLRGGEFRRRRTQHDELVKCASRTGTVDCLQAWAESSGQEFSHVYVTKGKPVLTEPLLLTGKRDCCAGLRSSLGASPDYIQVFDGASATIFVRNASSLR